MCTVYSAVRLLWLCVQCTVQSETVILVYTVHSVELDCYWCVYSAQCSETVIVVCTVYSAVRLLLVYVQCSVQ